MGRPKKRKVPSRARLMLASNIEALMKEKYRGSTNQPGALAKDANVTLSTIQRLLDPAVGANLDTIEAVARVFNLEAFELLQPVPRVAPGSPARRGQSPDQRLSPG